MSQTNMTTLSKIITDGWKRLALQGHADEPDDAEALRTITVAVLEQLEQLEKQAE